MFCSPGGSVSAMISQKETVSDLSYNSSMNQGIYGNGLKVLVLHSHLTWDKKLARRKNISGHEWVTQLQSCCILGWAFSVCTIYGNKMELCRTFHNCIMPSREKALTGDNWHWQVAPSVPMPANGYPGQAVTLQDWHWAIGLLKKVTLILLWRRDFPPWSGKWSVRLLKHRGNFFFPICALFLLSVLFQWCSLVPQCQHDAANGNLSKALNIHVLPCMYSLF